MYTNEKNDDLHSHRNKAVSLFTIKISILYLFLLLHTHIHIQSILKAWRFFHSFLELILGLSLIKKIILH